MSKHASLKKKLVAAAAAAAFFWMTPALANHTNDVALGADCPSDAPNHACNSGAPNSECRMKSDLGRLVCTDTSAPSGAVTGQASGSTSSGTAAPLLSVPIPTIKFTDIFRQNQGDNVILTIPWLAEYINGVYKYALGIASIIAAIMMMVGGFRWLTAGGDAGRVSAAKENIKNALIGLALTVGGYSMLAVVNSDLTTLKGLDILMVQKIEYETEDLQTTTADTSPSGSVEPGQVAGSHTAQFTSCPLNLTAAPVSNDNPSTNARAHEFFDQVSSITTGATVGERVVQIADAAAVCGVYFGSCGRTVGTAYTLAGFGTGGRDCLNGGRDGKGCWTHERARQVKTYSTAQVGKLHHYLCDNKCTGQPVNHPRVPPKVPNVPGCVATREAARNKLLTDMRQEIEARYPDSWAELLQPGDGLWIYNGYAPCTGLHSVIFMGWASNGKAQIVDGSAGRNARAGTVCLTSTCHTEGRPLQPIVKIFRP